MNCLRSCDLNKYTSGYEISYEKVKNGSFKLLIWIYNYCEEDRTTSTILHTAPHLSMSR